jgi:TonB family protein
MNPSIQTAQVLPARAVLFLGIVAAHALLAYAFASGMITTVTRVLLPDDIEIFKVPESKPDEEVAPPATKPTLFQAEAAPLPEIPDINLAQDATRIVLPPESVAIPGPATMPEPFGPPPIHLVGRNVMPNTADYYPPNEIRLGKEGTAEVRSCVDENGKLAGTPTLEASSGREPLDKAAIRLARDGKYARAMRGDTPVPNCYRFRVTFTLRGAG